MNDVRLPFVEGLTSTSASSTAVSIESKASSVDSLTMYGSTSETKADNLKQRSN